MYLITMITFGKIVDVKGKDLESWRERLGLTREELARELKTTYTTVYRWETDNRAIPPYLDLALKYIESEIKNNGKAKNGKKK